VEEKMIDLSIGTAISILVIAFAIISIGSIILAFEACPSQALNFSNNGSEEALDRTKIGDVLANPAKYQFDLVTVIGEYRGWQGEGTAPPVTRSDWVIKDDTGLIYVTGLLPGFDPVEDIGLILEVSGMVGVKEGEPYIEAKSVKIFNETKIGDILANPLKYQFGLVTVIGEYRGWQGEGTAPPITRSDWVIKDDTGLIYVTGLLPGFDPVEGIGLILEVSGMVMVKEGIPYIIAQDVTLPQKGDCKFKDTQKRPKRTYFQVFDNLNLVRSVLKSIFKEWNITNIIREP
jgi:hypothetical protein